MRRNTKKKNKERNKIRERIYNTLFVPLRQMYAHSNIVRPRVWQTSILGFTPPRKKDNGFYTKYDFLVYSRRIKIAVLNHVRLSLKLDYLNAEKEFRNSQIK